MPEGFILSSSIRDLGRDSTQLVFQGRLADGKRFRWSVMRPRLCFFMERGTPDPAGCRERRPVDLKTLGGAPVDALYFRSSLDLARARREVEGLGARAYESDISAPARHLMERNVKGGVRFLEPPVAERDGLLDFRDGRVEPSDFTPDLRLLSLDVECTPQGGLFSISIYGDGDGGGEGEKDVKDGKDGKMVSRVFMIDPARPAGEERDGYQSFPDERSLLLAFLSAVRAADPDALIGWNVVNFDLRYLAGRCERAGLRLDLGVDGPADLIEPEGGNAYGRFGSNWLARIPGRAVLDGINMLKAAFVTVESSGLGPSLSR